MKIFPTLIFVLLINISYSQTQPEIFLLNKKVVMGFGDPGDLIYIRVNLDSTKIDTISVNEASKFIFHFKPELEYDNIIKIWNNDENKPLYYQIYNNDSLLDSSTNYFNKNTMEAIHVANLNKNNLLLKNSILTYKSRIVNSNFQLPIARFNFNNNPNGKGNISLFTSIGAGVGVSWGRMEITRNDLGQILNEEFSSTFGFYFGALFSAGTGEDSNNIFAPTFNLSILDFQVGIGYELGTLPENQKPGFLTLAYGIPVYKLVKKSYRIWKITRLPYDSQNGPTD